MPEVYAVSIDVASLGLTPGVFIGTETAYDTALAYYSSSGALLNASTLQALAQRIAADTLSWRQPDFDMVAIGVSAVAPTGLYEAIEWDLGSTRCRTRVRSFPWNFGVRQLGHASPAQSACPDGTPGQTIMYGPPVPSGNSNSSFALDKFHVALQDGRLTNSYIGQDTFTCGCDHEGPCNVLVCAKACPGLTPIVGATVTISGVGTCTTSGSPNACCALSLPAAGTYTVTVSAAGYNSFTTTRMINCGDTITAILQPTTVVATVLFTVTGCCGGLLPGATITLSDGQSCTTDADGECSFWIGAAGTYGYSIAMDRFATATGNFTVDACATSTTNISTGMAPAGGYACGPLDNSKKAIPTPLRTTLHLTDPVFGSCTITYDPANLWWIGAINASFGGLCGCPAATFTATYALFQCRTVVGDIAASVAWSSGVYGQCIGGLFYRSLDPCPYNGATITTCAGQPDGSYYEPQDLNEGATWASGGPGLSFLNVTSDDPFMATATVAPGNCPGFGPNTPRFPWGNASNQPITITE